MISTTNSKILFLSEDDLNSHGIFESFDNTGIYDFKYEDKEIMLKVDVIIYKNNRGRYKVLKSRY